MRTEEPFWRPPTSQHEHWRLKESHLEYPAYHAPADNLTRALAHLAHFRRHLPTGSFVFVLSDFIESPPFSAWSEALEHPWDVVPVVIQDPVWEQSFPAVGGLTVPLADPATGQVRMVRLTRSEAEARRQANEERLERLLDGFGSLDLQPVLSRPAIRTTSCARSSPGRPSARRCSPGYEARAARPAPGGARRCARGRAARARRRGAPDWFGDEPTLATDERISASAAVTPRSHMFGDPVRARLDLVFSRRFLRGR